MKATTLSYIIAYAGLYSVVITVLAALYRYRYLRGPTFIFACLQSAALVIVVLSTLFFTRDNTYFTFIDISIDALAMSLMYAPLMPTKPLQQIVSWYGPLTVLGIIADYIWWEGLAKMGANLASGFNSFANVFILVIYLRQLLNMPQVVSLRRYPMFLISIGLLVASLLTTPIYFFIPALMSYSMTIAMRAYDLMFTVSFLCHVIYAVGFWFTKSEANASLRQPVV